MSAAPWVGVDMIMRGVRTRQIARAAERQNRSWRRRRSRKKTEGGAQPAGPVLRRTRSCRQRRTGHATEWIVAVVMLVVVLAFVLRFVAVNP